MGLLLILIKRAFVSTQFLNIRNVFSLLVDFKIFMKYIIKCITEYSEIIDDGR